MNCVLIVLCVPQTVEMFLFYLRRMTRIYWSFNFLAVHREGIKIQTKTSEVIQSFLHSYTFLRRCVSNSFTGAHKEVGLTRSSICTRPLPLICFCRQSFPYVGAWVHNFNLGCCAVRSLVLCVDDTVNLITIIHLQKVVQSMTTVFSRWLWKVIQGIWLCWSVTQLAHRLQERDIHPSYSETVRKEYVI